MSSEPLAIKIALSKSIANRMMAIAMAFDLDLSFAEEIKKQSDSQDVNDFFELLKAYKKKKREFYVGEGGAVLRFFVPILCLQKGEYFLELGAGLSKRPQDMLSHLCRQMNAVFDKKGNVVKISAGGFEGGDVSVDASKSSQALTGAMIALASLERPCKISLVSKLVSEPYIDMTLGLLRNAGLKIEPLSDGFHFEGRTSFHYDLQNLEPDMSSAFSLVACFFAANRSLKLEAFPINSLQGDSVFVSYLEELGAKFEIGTDSLLLKNSVLNQEARLSFNLKDTPDLFPVLVSLCAFRKGETSFYGAEHLVYKESNRIEAVSLLLERLGRSFTVKKDGLILTGLSHLNLNSELFANSYSDHRIAFSYAVLASFGVKVHWDEPEVVNKSYSQFWQHLSAGGVYDLHS